MAIKVGKLVFVPDWKTTIFTLLILPILLALGFWQLDRESEKQMILLQELQTMDAAPIVLPLSDKTADELPQFTRVELVGEFRSSLFLLDNRINNGRVGYEVLQLFDTVQGRAAWINRGFVAAGKTRTDLPLIEVPQGFVTLQAFVYRPYGKAYSLGATPIDSRPQDVAVIQTIDLTQISQFMQVGNSLPYELRLRKNSIAALDTYWKSVNVDPAKHRAYAVQWFAMSCALIIFYFLRSLQQRE